MAAGGRGFGYSRALRTAGLTWDRTMLDRFLAEGAWVVGGDLDAEPVVALGPQALGVVADTSRLADLDRVIAATREFGGGRIDVVFANAGVGTFGPLAATTEAMFDMTFDINVKGVYFTVQKAAALMQVSALGRVLIVIGCDG